MAYIDPRQEIPLSIAGPYHSARSLDLSAQTLKNWYLEINKIQEKTEAVLYPTPGTILIDAAGLGPHRGTLVHKGDAYFVSGNELIKMDSSEAITSIGTLSTSDGRVSMASNGTFGDQLMIVDGTYGYIWDGATLSTIVDAQFPANPTQVIYVDSFFLVITANSGQFNISYSSDGLNWDALDFANAERQPDDILAVQILDRDIYFIGDVTTEVWTNTGGSFPFEPYSDGVKEFGTSSKWAVAKYDSGIVFPTNSERGYGRVVLMHGTNYKVLSNSSIEYQLSTYSTLSNCYAFISEYLGHVFYQLTIPEAEMTFVCDLTIDDPELAWHTRSTNDLRHIAGTYLFYNKKHYVGAYNGPGIYYLDNNTYTDNGVAIKRERAGIHLADNRKNFRYDKVEFEFEGGIGLLSGQGSDPEILVDWSDDGGHNWKNTRHVKVGKRGEYGKRVLLHHCGSSRDRIFRIRTSDPVKYVLLGGKALVEELLN